MSLNRNYDDDSFQYVSFDIEEIIDYIITVERFL